MVLAAADLGFGPEADLRDRTQMLFTQLLIRRGATHFILKGGMAMRALYGSNRLTRDLDLDREDSVSRRSMQVHVLPALTQAARAAGLSEINVTQTKDAQHSNRWRIQGIHADGPRITWEVEISGRGIPPVEFIETRPFATPVRYRIPNFSVRVYGPAAMAGSKVNALVSENRSAPRDVYDLFELTEQQADPVSLWIQRIPRETLEARRPQVMRKIDLITFDFANAELLPYIALDIRAGIDAARWDEVRARVTDAVDQWFGRAIAGSKTAAELKRDPDQVDLAGR
jgi:predicted nucleotidyltransferase component of viral defense system